MKISEFLSENFQFLVVKFSIYLYRRVFVMGHIWHSPIIELSHQLTTTPRAFWAPVKFAHPHILISAFVVYLWTHGYCRIYQCPAARKAETTSLVASTLMRRFREMCPLCGNKGTNEAVLRRRMILRFDVRICLHRWHVFACSAQLKILNNPSGHMTSLQRRCNDISSALIRRCLNVTFPLGWISGNKQTCSPSQ